VKRIGVTTTYTGQSALASVPTLVALCPAVMEDCRHSYEEKCSMHC